MICNVLNKIIKMMKNAKLYATLAKLQMKILLEGDISQPIWNETNEKN